MLKIAVPVADGRLCGHFGHSEKFAFVDVDEKTRTIGAIEILTPPPHEPGSIPRWIAACGAKLAIAGGMGPGARQKMEDAAIQVITGAPVDTPEALVRAYLDGTLVCGVNACDHGADGHHHHHDGGHCHGNCHGHGEGHSCGA